MVVEVVGIAGVHAVTKALDALGGVEAGSRKAVAVADGHAAAALDRADTLARRAAACGTAVAGGGQDSARGLIDDVAFGRRQARIDALHHGLPFRGVVHLVPNAVDVLGSGGLHGGIDVGGRVEALHGLREPDDVGDAQVGGDVLRERLHGGRHGRRVGRQQLLGDGRHDQALVGGAILVARADLVVGVARAAQDKGLVAVKRLRSGIQVTAGILVVDGHGNVDLDAAERVHDIPEAIEVDLCVVRDIDARQLRHRLHRERGTAEHVRGIELVHAVFAHVDHGVAVQRDQRDLLAHGVDAREHDAVGAVAVAEIAGLVTFLGAIGSHEQHVERLFGHVGFDQVLPHVAQASVQVAGKHLHVRERRADGYDRHGKRRDAGIEQLAVLFMLVGFGVLVARKAACRRLALTSGRPVSAVAIARVAVLGAHICSGCAPAVG